MSNSKRVPSSSLERRHTSDEPVRLGQVMSVCMVGFLVLQSLVFDPSPFLKDHFSTQANPQLVKDYNRLTRKTGPWVADPNLDHWSQPTHTSEAYLHTSRLFRPSVATSADYPDSSLIMEGNQTKSSASANSSLVASSYSCRSSPSGPVQFKDYETTSIVDLETFMSVDTQTLRFQDNSNETSQNPYAMCQFMDYQYSHQFTHFMQQILRCWSYWQVHSEKESILVASKESHWTLAMDNRFNKGLISSLQDAGVRIVGQSQVTRVPAVSDSTESVSAHCVGPILEPDGNHFQTVSKEHLASFRYTVLSSLGFNETAANSFCSSRSSFPRIGILNRHTTRRLKNSRELAQNLTDYFNLTYQIPIVSSFDKIPFTKQIALLSTVDILITPHGAQETGIGFLPQCGGVLEIFPEGYLIPKLFGSLAASRGLQHGYLYLSPEDSSIDPYNILNRDVKSLCPPIQHIQDGVTSMIEQWRKCCAIQRST